MAILAKGHSGKRPSPFLTSLINLSSIPVKQKNIQVCDQMIFGKEQIYEREYKAFQVCINKIPESTVFNSSTSGHTVFYNISSWSLKT